MSNHSPKYLWGRENKNWTPPEKASEGGNMNESASDISGEFTSGRAEVISEMKLTDRIAAARNGGPQDLDVLVDDENYGVRRSVADRGRPQDLDILVNDREWWLRTVG